MDNNNITLKNYGLNYFIVEDISYIFSEFTFKDLNLDKLERLSLIKDGRYTDSNPRSLRNKEKQEYEALAMSINEKLKAKFRAPVNGYFKCGRNTKCRAAVGTAKVYDTGDDIIALYLTLELQQ